MATPLSCHRVDRSLTLATLVTIIIKRKDPQVENASVASRRSRATRQGGLVRDELAANDTFRSAQAVFAQLRSKGEAIGLSTVYRHLQALADAGDADTLQNPEGEALYRLCGRGEHHHHHLVCRRCGQTQEIEGRGVERWATQVAEEHGFTDVGHTIELVGLCRNCSR